ncbi:MAG TPA: hypothetical protein VGL82_17535 [Bryobacteraceae bacterium]
MARRLLLFVLTVCLLCAQTQIPQFQAENLAGGKVIMPGSAHGQPALLVVGFTHASGAQCTAWMKRLKSEFAATAALQQYAVIFLEDAPRLVRPMAKSGIKSSAPQEDYGQWLIVTEHEKEMKAAVHFQAPDDPYLVLLGADGAVRWTGHGAVSDELLNQIRAALKS